MTSRELFGRESELAWLDRCWENGVHIASVIAWGGVGKSALGNTWLARLRDRGWGGSEKVFGWSFYSQGADGVASSDEFIDAALRWFGDPDPTVGLPWDKGERLAALVRKERTILVLDGLEPLQWGPGMDAGRLKDPAVQALVKELGAQNKGLCLITTRIAVADLEAWVGDRVEEHRLEHLPVAAGAELLKARGARGAEEDLYAAAEEYEGHGLALTLLGGYVRKRYKGDIRQRAHIPLVEGKPVQRMMATYERWLARKPEIAVLRMLGLFDRPGRADEIRVLRSRPPISGLTTFLVGLGAGAWSEAVTTLEDLGLLAPNSTGDEQLDAHPLVRDYFAEVLRRQQPRAWREGNRRLYGHLCTKANYRPHTVEEVTLLYHAVVHGCRAGKGEEALREVWWKRIRGTDDDFKARKLLSFGSEATAFSAFFDPPWEKLAPGLSEVDGTSVMCNAGFALAALGRLHEATGLMQMALEVHVAKQAWDGVPVLVANLCEILQARGEVREALVQARRGVDAADRSGDAAWRTWSRTVVGAALHAVGLREEAATWFEDADRMTGEWYREHSQIVGIHGFWYCDLLLDQGRHAEVLARAASALKIVERSEWLLNIGLDHLSLGRAHLLAIQCHATGDLAEATFHFSHAVNDLRLANQQQHVPLGLLARAALHSHTRAFDLARKDLDEALTLSTRCGFRLHECDAHLGLARLDLAEENPVAARSHVDRARQLIDTTGYHRRDAELADLTLALA